MTKSLTKTLRAAKAYSQHIITHRLNLFLMSNPNLVLDDIVADMIRREITKQPRDRKQSFSSSAAGTCQRRQIFQFLGIDPGGVTGPQLQNIFYDGTWRHLRWQATLLQAGILRDIEFPLVWDAMRSRGTMDGVGVVPDDHPNEKWRGLEFGFELKGINSFGYKSAVANGVKEEHLDQVHRYFLSGGFELFVIIYENKDTQEWTEWVVEPDPARMERQRQELVALNGYVEREELPPMLPGCVTMNSTEWKWCQYAGENGVCVRRNHW